MRYSLSNDAIASRYLGQAPNAVYLIRLNQHVAARWDHFDEVSAKAAIAKALGLR